MAYFDKKDIQNSFAKAITDEFVDVWGWENDNEYKSLVMEVNGICNLYKQIIYDMQDEDYKMEMRRKEAEKNNGGE